MSLAEREEADLQQAMALSTSQHLPAQETGTIPADKTYFGPARQEYHDTKNWIMTTSKSTAKEIILNPEPKDRRRQSKTPAFLRPSPAGHRLPGVFKVLHVIPAAREALLGDRVSTDYGHHNEWWDGITIETPRIVHAEEDHTTPGTDVVYESQRLMAFLDETERAYGSTESLSTFPGLREYQGDAVVKGFLHTWSRNAAYYNSTNTLCDLFQSTGTKVSQDNRQSEDVVIVDLDLNELQHVEPGHTIYDAMDALLWPSWDGTEHNQQIFFDKVADVLLIRIARADDTVKGIDIKIPSVWYSDRYRQSSKTRVQQMLAAKAAVKREIDDLDTRKQKASEFKGLNQQGSSFDVNRLLTTAKQHFETTAKYNEDTKSTQAEATGQEVPTLKAYSMIAEELKVLSDRVAGKLQMFEESKELARDKLRELSKLFTEPSDIPEESPQDRYTLRGVCAEPHTVYVQERANPHAADDLVGGLGEEEWQWWKLSYEASAAHPISTTKVREIEVLNAARHEASTAFLVYASDRAMAVEKRPLPPPLENFVRADNRAFAAEIASSASPPPQPIASNNPYYQPPSSEAFRSPQRRPRPEDFDLPPYDHTFPAPPRDKSYDDFIPISLRGDSMDMDDPVEMIERGSAGNAFGGGKGGRDGYRLGNYVPEIQVEDSEEDRRQRGREG